MIIFGIVYAALLIIAIVVPFFAVVLRTVDEERERRIEHRS